MQELVDGAGQRRRLNVTHVVAAGVLVVAVPAQWFVSQVAVASVQLVSPKAGWQLGPVVLVVAVLLGLLVYAGTRPEPVPGLVRSIGVQALALAGGTVLVLELVVSVLGIVWEAGSGGLRAGAGVWMATIAGLLLVVVGDRDPLSVLLPGGRDSRSVASRLLLGGAWVAALGLTTWWTAWRNEPFAEVGPLVFAASSVPVVGTVSFLGVVGCWVGLAVALVGRTVASAVLVGLGCLLLAFTAMTTSVMVLAVDALPVDELLGVARERAVEWTESAGLPDAVPGLVEQRLGPTLEQAEVELLVRPGVLWLVLALTFMALALVALVSRRQFVGSSSGAVSADVGGIAMSGRPIDGGERPWRRL